MARGLLITVIVTLLAAAVAQGSPSAPGSVADENIAEKKAMLSRILQKPVYQRWKLRQDPDAAFREESVLAQMARDALESIWDGVKRLFKWLWKQLRRANISLPDLPSTPGNLVDYLKMGAWAAFGALLLAAGLYLYGMRGKLRNNIRLAAALSREKVQEALENGQALALDADGWMSEAERMGAEGDFRAMYRAIYLGLLSSLHQNGRIDYRKNRTNWSYVNGYKGTLNDQADFGALTEIFDQVWYGQKPAGGVSLEELKTRAGRLLAGRGQA